MMQGIDGTLITSLWDDMHWVALLLSTRVHPKYTTHDSLNGLKGLGGGGNQNNHGKMVAASKLVSKRLTWLCTGLKTCQLQAL